MQNKPSLAIIADFNPANDSHIATNEAIAHCAKALELNLHHEWIATDQVLKQGKRLEQFTGFWIGPASPYRSMDGAIAAIEFARENRVPLLGTCGGFQHIILEYARNVLGFADAEHEETTPAASRLFISRLACSLLGRTMTIRLEPKSTLARLYGRTTIQEQYYCSFGVNPTYVETLRASGLRIAASDDEGLIRAVELPDHPFFLGTLFLPQHNSTAASPHPVISGFLKACALGADK